MNKNHITALLCLVPYLGFWLYGLTDLDEGFYGAVATDMLRRGDWITPTYNGVPWFEKPILSYWLAMPGLALFPSNDFIARLPSLICTLLTTLVIFRFCKKQFDEPAARFSTLVFSSCLLTVALGRQMMTDPALVLALTTAFTSFINSLTDNNPKLKLATAAALGFAVLAKGPVALVLFGAFAAIAYWRIPEWRQSFKGPWIVGTILLLAIVATWYIPAYLANGQTFVQTFLIDQNIGRFKGGDTSHTVPWYLNLIYFPLISLIAFSPWLATAYASGAHKTKQGTGNPRNVRIALWIWALVVVGFFTISKTKLPHYVLPAMAPLAILIAEAIVHRDPKRRSEHFWTRAAAAWAVFVCLLATTLTYSFHQKQFAEIQAIGKYLQTKSAPVAVLKLGRQGPDPTIKLTLDQVSHPSLLFYLRRPITMTDNPAQIPTDPGTYVILRSQNTPENHTQTMPGFTIVPPQTYRWNTPNPSFTLLKRD